MAEFDHALPMILYRTLDAVMPVYRDLFARYDVTEQQWRVLRVIWMEGRTTAAELSERTLLSPPSLVGIIDRLEKKGLVSRIRSVSDRREIHVTATARGRVLQEEVIPQVEKIQASLREAVSPREWASMEKTLEKIARSMTGDGVVSEYRNTGSTRG
ncbi:MAG: MarR family transcriptional regulator [Hyphomicrobiales bacterium]|nr:MarR family transcriptional regulator [Hyphomicrobiales bacterium]